MGRIGRIIKSVGSGLVDFARAAENTIGDFERVFGNFAGPGEGMASQKKIMRRSAGTGGKEREGEGRGESLQDKVSLNGGNNNGDGGGAGLPDPGNIGMSNNSGNDKDGFNYI